MKPIHPPPNELLYPAEDAIRAENNYHYKQVHLLVDALQRHFAGRNDTFVGGNIFLLWYDDSGQYERVAPDVLVAFGVAPLSERERDSYLVWEEGVPPALVIEIESGSPMDYHSWPRQCEIIGVQEYYRFDAESSPLDPQLEGYYRGPDGRYLYAKGSVLDSLALGLQLVIVAGWLRLRNPTTGQLLATNVELAQELTAAEAEVARLRAELARLQAPPDPR